jgi:HEAT repeat protein
VPALTKCFEDPDPFVQSRAASALRKLGDLDALESSLSELEVLEALEASHEILLSLR